MEKVEKIPNKKTIVDFVSSTLDNSPNIKEGLQNVINYLKIMLDNLDK